MNVSRAAVTISTIIGKLLSIFGYITAFITFIVIVVLVEDAANVDEVDIALLLIFIAIAAALITGGIKIKRRIRRFRRYVAFISTSGTTSIDNIAANTGKSVNFVRNDLQKMITKKFFANATIDYVTNEIIIRGVQPVQATNPGTTKLEAFTCMGCGASGTRLQGSSGNCDYCGTLN